MLAQAGIGLRLRRAGTRSTQTVKGPATGPHGGGLSTRTEFEWPVAGHGLDPLRFATTPFRRVLGKAERRGLSARFVTDIRRTTIPLAFADGTMASLCIDAGEIRADINGDVTRQPIHEMEIELEAGDPCRLYELASALASEIRVALEPLSKAQRGYALRSATPPTPLRAVDATLPGKSNAGATIAAIIRACLAQIEGNAHGLLVDDDVEWVHQMRIGVRRLRACLSLSRRGFEPARIEPVRVELRWLAQALGPARDFDVFATQTLPSFREAVARSADAKTLEPALRPLAARAAARRRDARVAARAAVDSSRFVRLVLAAGVLAAAPEQSAHDGNAGSFDEPARDLPNRCSSGVTAPCLPSAPTSRTLRRNPGMRPASQPRSCATRPSSLRRSLPANGREATARPLQFSRRNWAHGTTLRSPCAWRANSPARHRQPPQPSVAGLRRSVTPVRPISNRRGSRSPRRARSGPNRPSRGQACSNPQRSVTA